MEKHVVKILTRGRAHDTDTPSRLDESLRRLEGCAIAGLIAVGRDKHLAYALGQL
jgi:hypothetical protein